MWGGSEKTAREIDGPSVDEGIPLSFTDHPYARAELLCFLRMKLLNALSLEGQDSVSACAQIKCTVRSAFVF